MIGLGAANLAAGLFQGFPISSSSSRTPVAEAAGSKTQLTGVVGALAVALLVVLAPNLLKDLPNSALAAIVISAAIGLFEFADLRRIFRIQRWEFWLSIVCFVGVAVFGAIPARPRDRHRHPGIPVDGWRPHYAVLGRVTGMRGYHDIKRYPMRVSSPDFCCSVGMPAVLRQCRVVSPAHSRSRGEFAYAGQADHRGGRAGHQHRRDLGGHARRTRAGPAGVGHRAAVRRIEGSGQGQAEALRTARAFRHHELLSHPGAAIDAYLEEHKVDWKP
jgi:hypothetical protein